MAVFFFLFFPPTPPTVSEFRSCKSPSSGLFSVAKGNFPGRIRSLLLLTLRLLNCVSQTSPLCSSMLRSAISSYYPSHAVTNTSEPLLIRLTNSSACTLPSALSYPASTVWLISNSVFSFLHFPVLVSLRLFFHSLQMHRPNLDFCIVASPFFPHFLNTVHAMTSPPQYFSSTYATYVYAS